MNAADRIKRLYKKAGVDIQTQADEARFSAIRTAYIEHLNSTAVSHRQSVWRLIMKSPMTRLATVICVAIVIGMVFHLPEAYALSQTIKANNSIRWLRVKHTLTWANPERMIDICFAYDDQGEVARFRASTNTAGPPIGPVTMTYQANREEVWFPDHNVCLIGKRDPRYLLGALGIHSSELNPVILFKKLSEQEKQRLVQVQIDQPSDKQAPIIVTVTYPEGSRSRDWKKVITIDQATNWVQKIDKFVRQDEGFKLYSSSEFFDYNHPLDDEVFTVKKDAGPDANLIDVTNVPIAGMLQGEMTDQQMVEALVQQFFEAIIAKDYQQMSQLLLSLPEFLTQQYLAIFGSIQFDRILSVGPGYPDPDPDSNQMICPCKVLVKIMGKDHEVTCHVYAIQNQKGPSRWTIISTLWGQWKPIEE